ncbi:MAG: glutathione S-transferase family protein [Alphaproteobacteria bacterium]|nr:glutathione S-transferase family protein [Alphaproteobacteria bacterium]
MKLYNADLSPYASRVRMQLYLKGIKAELVAVAAGGSHTAEYAKMNPLEKIPTLDDGGFYLPESSAIMEYLEDTHPTPSLRPTDAKERAKMRVLFNIADQYLLTPLFELFEQANPATRDAKKVDAGITDLSKALGALEHFVSGGKYAQGSSATLADCALVPALFFVGAIGPFFGQSNLMGPKVKAYYTAIQTDPHAAKVVQELGTALADYMKQGA